MLPTRSAEVDIVAAVVMHWSLRQHGVVLEFSLADWWAVVADDDELASALTEC